MTFKIEICEADMVDELLQFIDNHWRKNHIFVHNRTLFDFQHKNAERYNFILARQDGDIIAVLGFIPTSQYSSELAVNNELWLAIWKVRDDIKKPGLGLMMLSYLKKHYNKPTICSLGLSQQVIPIYKALKYQVGILSHYAFFNQTAHEFSFVVPKVAYLTKCDKCSVTIKPTTELTETAIDSQVFSSHPKKNVEYLVNRYLNHPTYQYGFMVFEEQGSVISIAVYRVIDVGSSKIARVVDVQGENIMEAKFNQAISQFINQQNLEYLDIVSTLKAAEESGFIENSNDLVIPNYFEPLEMKNVSIDYAYKSQNELAIFRGDSDQDRPNT